MTDKWLKDECLSDNAFLRQGDDARIRTRVAQLFENMDDMLDESDEKRAGMRKLLEAKDCFLRAAER